MRNEDYCDFIHSKHSVSDSPEEWERNVEQYLHYLNKTGYKVPVARVMGAIEVARLAAIATDIENEYDSKCEVCKPNNIRNINE